QASNHTLLLTTYSVFAFTLHTTRHHPSFTEPFRLIYSPSLTLPLLPADFALQSLEPLHAVVGSAAEIIVQRQVLRVEPVVNGVRLRVRLVLQRLRPGHPESRFADVRIQIGRAHV